ncbi:MAG: methionine aminotransferase [Polyangiaceae bacterium]
MIQSKLPHVGTTIFTVMSRLAEQTGALNLGQGFPDFEPPALFAQSLAQHTASGKNQYAAMAGVPRLRQQIADKLKRDYGASLSPDTDITVVSGATEGIFDAIAAAVHPGDEVIVLDPCYDSYEPSVTLQGGRTIHVPLERDFSVDWDRVERALTPRTRLLMVNFPHNPSGAVLRPGDLDALARVLRNSSAMVVSDEVYEHIVFDGQPHQSLLRHPELAAKSFVVGSFGKAYHATGWKIGWVAAPAALSHELRRVHQFVTFSSSNAAQHAFADLLEHQPSLLAELPLFYQSKRDQFRRLIASSRFELLPVAGTYFQLADYSELSQDDDRTFTQRLAVEAGVVAIPISVFYAEPPARKLVRFCFAKNDITLEHAAARLCEL